MANGYSELGLPRFDFFNRHRLGIAMGVAFTTITLGILGTVYDNYTGERMERSVLDDISTQLDDDAAQVSVELTPFAIPLINEHQPTVRVSGLGKCAISISQLPPDSEAPQLRLIKSADADPSVWQIVEIDGEAPSAVTANDLELIIEEYCPKSGSTIRTTASN